MVAARVASAQPGATEPTVQPPALLDENKAMWLTVGGTMGAYTLLGVTLYTGSSIGPAARGPLLLTGLAATLIAPSFGHWYAGKAFTRGLGFRLGALATTFMAFGAASSCGSFFQSHGNSEDCSGKYGGALVLGVAALGMWVYGTLHDVIDAKRRVQRINAERLEVSIVPALGDEQLGVALVGRF